jgi:hypothetical protein
MIFLVLFDSLFLCCTQFGCYGINDSLIFLVRVLNHLCTYYFIIIFNGTVIN